MNITRIILFFSFAIGINHAWSVPENQLLASLNKNIYPNFSKNFIKGSFQGKKNVQIQYAYKINPKATTTLVIIPGKGESFLKYQEVFYDFKDFPVSIFTIDHRGQGLSSRETKTSDMMYVRTFAHYSDDLLKFVEDIVEPNTPSENKIVAMAHSMGAHIVARLQSKEPVFDGLILNAPMLDVGTGKYSPFTARMLAEVFSVVGKRRKFADGQGPYHADAKFLDNVVTHSQPRWKMSRQLHDMFPIIKMGGVSWGWFLATLRSNGPTLRKSKGITIPTLVFKLGKDSVVRDKAIDQFCHNVKNCNLEFFPNARHELFQESDPMRNRAIKLAKEFILDL
jgi:lysophospholipase